MSWSALVPYLISQVQAINEVIPLCQLAPSFVGQFGRRVIFSEAEDEFAEVKEVAIADLCTVQEAGTVKKSQRSFPLCVLLPAGLQWLSTQSMLISLWHSS